MSANVTARRVRRERADSPLEVIGVTDIVGGTHLVVWRIQPARTAETPIPAIRAALGRVCNTPDGLTFLDGAYVNESDLTALFHATAQALRSGAFICRHDSFPLGTDGHCPECVREQVRWDR